MSYTEVEIDPEVARLLAEEARNPLAWRYLSFADEDGFRGVVIIQAHGIVDAAFRAGLARINPGGEILSFVLQDEDLPAPEWRNRLLSEADLRAIWPDIQSLAHLGESEKQP